MPSSIQNEQETMETTHQASSNLEEAVADVETAIAGVEALVGLTATKNKAEEPTSGEQTDSSAPESDQAADIVKEEGIKEQNGSNGQPNGSHETESTSESQEKAETEQVAKSSETEESKSGLPDLELAKTSSNGQKDEMNQDGETRDDVKEVLVDNGDDKSATVENGVSQNESDAVKKEDINVEEKTDDVLASTTEMVDNDGVVQEGKQEEVQVATETGSDETAEVSKKDQDQPQEAGETVKSAIEEDEKVNDQIEGSTDESRVAEESKDTTESASNTQDDIVEAATTESGLASNTMSDESHETVEKETKDATEIENEVAKPMEDTPESHGTTEEAKSESGQTTEEEKAPIEEAMSQGESKVEHIQDKDDVIQAVVEKDKEDVIQAVEKAVDTITSQLVDEAVKLNENEPLHPTEEVPSNMQLTEENETQPETGINMTKDTTQTGLSKEEPEGNLSEEKQAVNDEVGQETCTSKESETGTENITIPSQEQMDPEQTTPEALDKEPIEEQQTKPVEATSETESKQAVTTDNEPQEQVASIEDAGQLEENDDNHESLKSTEIPESSAIVSKTEEDALQQDPTPCQKEELSHDSKSEPEVSSEVTKCSEETKEEKPADQAITVPEVPESSTIVTETEGDIHQQDLASCHAEEVTHVVESESEARMSEVTKCFEDTKEERPADQVITVSEISESSAIVTETEEAVHHQDLASCQAEEVTHVVESEPEPRMSEVTKCFEGATGLEDSADHPQAATMTETQEPMAIVTETEEAAHHQDIPACQAEEVTHVTESEPEPGVSEVTKCFNAATPSLDSEVSSLRDASPELTEAESLVIPTITEPVAMHSFIEESSCPSKPREEKQAFMTEVLEPEDILPEEVSSKVNKDHQELEIEETAASVKAESAVSSGRAPTRCLTAAPLQPEPILSYTHVACIAVVALVAIYFFFCI